MVTARSKPAVVRWALGVVVVLAVLGMHSLMSTAPAAEAHPDPASTVQSAAVHDHPVAATAGAATEPGVCTDGCGGHELHSLAHLCLAVLVGAVALLAARLLHAAHPVERHSPRRWVVLAVADVRAPPWTQPTLAQLSVLRV